MNNYVDSNLEYVLKQKNTLHCKIVYQGEKLLKKYILYGETWNLKISCRKNTEEERNTGREK